MGQSSSTKKEDNMRNQRSDVPELSDDRGNSLLNTIELPVNSYGQATNNNNKWVKANVTRIHPDLPIEVYVMIFGHIDVTDIVSLQIVSKCWCDLLRSQSVWRVKCQQYWPRYPIKHIDDYWKFFLHRGGVYFIRSAAHLQRLITPVKKDFEASILALKAYKLSNGLVIALEREDRSIRKPKNREFWSKTAPKFKDGSNLVLAPKYFEDEEYDYILFENSVSHILEQIWMPKMFPTASVAHCTEKKVITIVLQVMNAIQILFDNNIMDINWEEDMIYFDVCGDWYEVKIDARYNRRDRRSSAEWTTDFIPFGDNESSSQFSYHMWCLGALTYTLLTGYPPFWIAENDSNESNRYRARYEARYTWPENEPISDNAKDFVNRLIVVDPTKRMTLKEAFAHPWLNDPNPSTTRLNDSADLPRSTKIESQWD